MRISLLFCIGFKCLYLICNSNLYEKTLWTLLAVGWMVTSSATPPAHLVDSLESAYQAEPDARKRVDILLNLKDLNDSSEDELYYSRQAVRRGGRRR